MPKTIFYPLVLIAFRFIFPLFDSKYEQYDTYAIDGLLIIFSVGWLIYKILEKLGKEDAKLIATIIGIGGLILLI